MMNNRAYMTPNAIDKKKREYITYLERSGVIEVLTRSLAALMQESTKPADPVQFILQTSNMAVRGAPTVDALSNQLEQVIEEKRVLEEENERLKNTISQMKASSGRVGVVASFDPHVPPPPLGMYTPPRSRAGTVGTFRKTDFKKRYTKKNNADSI